MDDSTPGELRDDANAIIAWLKAHPKIVTAVGWFVVGFVLGLFL